MLTVIVTFELGHLLNLKMHGIIPPRLNAFSQTSNVSATQFRSAQKCNRFFSVDAKPFSKVSKVNCSSSFSIILLTDKQT